MEKSGGAVFGMVMTGVMTLISLVFLNATVSHVAPFIVVSVLTVLVHSALGALVSVAVKEVFEAQTLANFLGSP